jgi:hypothetical protein
MEENTPQITPVADAPQVKPKRKYVRKAKPNLVQENINKFETMASSSENAPIVAMVKPPRKSRSKKNALPSVENAATENVIKKEDKIKSQSGLNKLTAINTKARELRAMPEHEGKKWNELIKIASQMLRQ